VEPVADSAARNGRCECRNCEGRSARCDSIENNDFSVFVRDRNPIPVGGDIRYLRSLSRKVLTGRVRQINLCQLGPIFGDNNDVIDAQ
jgi:hypothetical protein